MTRLSDARPPVKHAPVHQAIGDKRKEAAVTRELIEQGLALGGDGCIELFRADALYANGPLPGWLNYRKGIDAQAVFSTGRLLDAD